MGGISLRALVGAALIIVLCFDGVRFLLRTSHVALVDQYLSYLDDEGVPESLVAERQRHLDDPHQVTEAELKELRGRWERALRDREATEEQYRELHVLAERVKDVSPSWVAEIQTKLASDNRLSQGDAETLLEQGNELRRALEREALREVVAVDPNDLSVPHVEYEAPSSGAESER